MHWIDCGLNLHSAQFSNHEQILQSAAAAQVDRFVLISSDLTEAERIVASCEQYPVCIGTVGVHPHQADHTTLVDLERLKSLSTHESIRAIGECGLDYNRNFSAPAKQREVFARQVALAVELQLPLYLHERDAIDDQLAILREHQGNLPPLFVHCFTQGREALERYQALDAYFGVTGWVCDERRGQALVDAIPYISESRLLLETDAPYLQPRTLKPKPSSRSNFPHYLPHIAERVASLRNVSLEHLAAVTCDNAVELFGAWPHAKRQREGA